MNTTSPTLDQAPPDCGAYARTAQEHAEEHNRWLASRTRLEVRQREEWLTMAGYSEQEINEFWRWLEA